MRMIALDIPEQPDDIATWLEHQMMKGDLLDLVTELEAVHGGSSERPALDDVLGDTESAVLERGLSALSETPLKQLLQHPLLLLDLQERILLESTPYWQARLADAEAVREVAETKQALMKLIAGKVERPVKRSSSSIVRAALTLAACLVIVCGIAYVVYEPPNPPAVAWGWLSEDAMSEGVGPDEYLLKLADGGQQFFKKDPANHAAFRNRVEELRDGCQRLIEAAHTPLPADDRDLLVGRCQRWLGELNAHLKAMEGNDFDLAEVKQSVSRDVREMIDTIKRHAKQLS